MGGQSRATTDMVEFNDFIQHFALGGNSFFGSQFTWSRKSGDSMVLERLDRALGNSEWLNTMVDLEFNSFGMYNFRSLAFVVSLAREPSSFKLQYMWFSHPSFLGVKIKCWSNPFGLSDMVHGMIQQCLRVKDEERRQMLFSMELWAQRGRAERLRISRNCAM